MFYWSVVSSVLPLISVLHQILFRSWILWSLTLPIISRRSGWTQWAVVCWEADGGRWKLAGGPPACHWRTARPLPHWVLQEDMGNITGAHKWTLGVSFERWANRALIKSTALRLGKWLHSNSVKEKPARATVGSAGDLNEELDQNQFHYGE